MGWYGNYPLIISQFANLKPWPISFVDLPRWKMAMFQFANFVGLPEGRSNISRIAIKKFGGKKTWFTIRNGWTLWTSKMLVKTSKNGGCYQWWEWWVEDHWIGLMETSPDTSIVFCFFCLCGGGPGNTIVSRRILNHFSLKLWESMARICVNYNDLTVLPHWNHGLC